MSDNYSSWVLAPAVMKRKLHVKDKSDSAAAQLPPERQGSLLVGILVHLGGVVAYGVILALLPSQSVWNSLVWALACMAVTLAAIIYFEWSQPVAQYPPPSARDVWDGVVLVFVTGVFLGGCVVAVGWKLTLHACDWAHAHLSASLFPAASERGFSGWSIAYATLLTDFFYYFYHRFGGHGTGTSPVRKFLQDVHMPHHGVRVLDFFRGNLSSVFDTAVLGFQLPLGLIVAPLYQMDLPSTAAAYMVILLLQATHHVNHTFNIGSLRFVFVDNHAHKHHHCPYGSNVNLGACFALWDRNLGTFYEDFSIATNLAQQGKVALPVRSKRADSGEDGGLPGTTMLVAAFISALFLLPRFVFWGRPWTALVVLVTLSVAAAAAASRWAERSARSGSGSSTSSGSGNGSSGGSSDMDGSGSGSSEQQQHLK